MARSNVKSRLHDVVHLHPFMQGRRKQFLVGGGQGTRLHRCDSTPTVLVNFTVVLHIGNIQIQIVQLKYFKLVYQMKSF